MHLSQSAMPPFFKDLLSILYCNVVFFGCIYSIKCSSATAKYREDVPAPGVSGDVRTGADERVFMGYSDSWVVEVPGREDTADAIADQHGFVNLGQVGRLEGVFHFALQDGSEDAEGGGLREGAHGGTARNRSGTLISVEMPERTAELNAEENVVLSTQQKVFRREKRDSFSYPSDPLWDEQWALHNVDSYGRRGYDLNVLPAWIQGYTGKGVVVTVVDDGLLSSHPDLSENFDSSASYNYIEAVADPSPYSAYDYHGTNCAGEIGMARDNNHCGTGVAYNSKLGGIRVDLSYLSDVTEAQALSFQRDYISIYSNSWGPPDNGFLVQGPGYYAGRVLKEGASKGRNGLGSIWVWASGNGGRNDDSCAADGYASSMYTIAVGSADPNGRQAYYDEPCSGKMAVTFSYSSNRYTQLVTTSTQSKCSTSFTGTSASAPLTAGVIALVLEANPNLSWRDVQYLIAYTSDPAPFQSASGWAINGAGLLVSHQFGFGAIDAEAMVTRAQHWASVPQQRTCTINPTARGNLVASSGEPLKIEFEVQSSGDCSVVYLEHVMVQMTLSLTVNYGGTYSYNDYFSNPDVLYHDGVRRGDILMELYSPQGTRSILLPEREKDFVNAQGYYSWPFTSVHHWGEDPVGVWEIVVYLSSPAGYVTVGDLAAVLHGTDEVPEAVQRIPDQCSPECTRGCAAEGQRFCDSCKKLRMLSDLRCVSSCPGESNTSRRNMSTCSFGGYCTGCKDRFLRLSWPVIGLLAVTGLVFLIGTAAILFILWSRLCRRYNDYTRI